MPSQPTRTIRLVVGIAVASLVVAACSGGSEESDAYVDAVAEELATAPEDGELVLPEDSARCFAEEVVEILDPDTLADAGVTPEDLGAMTSFTELGVELPDDAQARVADAATDCFDVRASLAEAFSTALGIDVSCVTDQADEDQVADVFAEQLVTGRGVESSQALLTDLFDEMSPACGEEIFLGTAEAQGVLDADQRACVADQLDDDVARRALVASTTGDADEAELASINDEINAAFGACGVAAAG